MMRHQQSKYIVGYATIRMEGKQTEQFIQLCINEQIPVWNIIMLSSRKYEAMIYLHHFEQVKEIASTFTHFKVELVQKRGIFVKIKAILARKEWLLACIISIFFLFLLANTAWKVDIKGVPIHLERAIEDKLEQVGLYEGAWVYSLDPLEIVQDELLNDIPDLLYIGIEQKGTSYYIDAIEKKIEHPKEDTTTTELTAKKDGIIDKMFIESGIPVVKRNDMVKKGDVLVTNKLELLEEDNKKDDKAKKIPVKGKVYANTWYNVKVSVALDKSQASLTGKNKTYYHLQVGTFSIPVWGWKEQPYTDQIAEYDVQPIRLWKWTLPITWVKKELHEYEAHTTSLSQKIIEEKMLKHIEENVKRTYGQDTEVLNYYVLHETIDNGKVKMNLYVSLMENIAKSD